MVIDALCDKAYTSMHSTGLQSSIQTAVCFQLYFKEKMSMYSNERNILNNLCEVVYYLFVRIYM